MSPYARCSEDGCNRDELSNGYCYSHAYDALRRELDDAFGLVLLVALLVAAAGIAFLIATRGRP